MFREGSLVCDGKFILLKAIGEGGYGAVWEAQETTSQMPVAVKLLQDERPGDYTLLRELRLQWFMRQCPQIPHIFDSRTNAQVSVLVMELLDCDLDYWLSPEGQRTEKATLLHARLLLYQLLNALRWLHKCDIVHRDIKSKNIMLHKTWLLKLIDLGEGATSVDPGNDEERRRGAPHTRAPELLIGVGPHTCATDMWAAGVVALRVMHAVYAPRVPVRVGEGSVSEVCFHSGPDGQGLPVRFTAHPGGGGLLCEVAGEAVKGFRQATELGELKLEGYSLLQLPGTCYVPLPHNSLGRILSDLKTLAKAAGAVCEFPEYVQEGRMCIDETDENLPQTVMGAEVPGGLAPLAEHVRAARLYHSGGYFAAVVSRGCAAAGGPGAGVVDAVAVPASAKPEPWSIPASAAAGIADDFPDIVSFAAALRKAGPAAAPAWGAELGRLPPAASHLLTELLSFDPAERGTAAGLSGAELFADPDFKEKAAALLVASTPQRPTSDVPTPSGGRSVDVLYPVGEHGCLHRLLTDVEQSAAEEMPVEECYSRRAETRERVLKDLVLPEQEKARRALYERSARSLHRGRVQFLTCPPKAQASQWRAPMRAVPSTPNPAAGRKGLGAEPVHSDPAKCVAAAAPVNVGEFTLPKAPLKVVKAGRRPVPASPPRSLSPPSRT